MIVSHAFATLTSRMALRETFLRLDLEPRVATSLRSVMISCARGAARGSCSPERTRLLLRHISVKLAPHESKTARHQLSARDSEVTEASHHD